MQPLPSNPKFVRRCNIGEQACAAGEILIAQTDKGTPVQVWRPLPEVAKTRYGFFCHGHATLSHHLHGYSILGESLETVLREEWTRVNRKPIKGDIVVFRAADKSIAHTARIESAVHSFGASTVKTLSTKNGTFTDLLTGQSIDQVQGAYHTATWRMTGCTCCGSVLKQYYRRNNREIDNAHTFA